MKSSGWRMASVTRVRSVWKVATRSHTSHLARAVNYFWPVHWHKVVVMQRDTWEMLHLLSKNYQLNLLWSYSSITLITFLQCSNCILGKGAGKKRKKFGLLPNQWGGVTRRVVKSQVSILRSKKGQKWLKMAKKTRQTFLGKNKTGGGGK